MDNHLPLSCLKVISSRSQVECCSFSPNGDTLAACLSDGSVRLYSVSVSASGLETVELKHQFNEHQSNVWCISFSSDGLHLSSCSSDHSVIIYSLSTFAVKHVLNIHSDTVWCCSYSTLSLLATASQDCTVKICNQQTYDIKCTLTIFQYPVVDLSFNKEGDRLCTCTCDGEVIVWVNLHHQSSCPVGLHVHSNVARICKFVSIDGIDYIISSLHDHCIDLIDIRGGVEQIHAASLQQFASSSSPSAGSGEDNCEIMDIRSSVERVQQFKGHCNIVWSLCCLQLRRNSDQLVNVLVTCAGDRTMRYWDLSTGQCLKILRKFPCNLEPNCQILSCDSAHSKDQWFIAAATYDGGLYVCI